MTAPKLRFKEFDGDWCLRTLGNTAEFVSGYAFDSEKFGENGRKLITPKNFTTNGKALFTKQNTKYTTEECDEKFVCSGNDLLVLLTDLTQSCELLGKPVLLTHTHEDILLNQRILKIQPDENVLNKVFLLNFLLTESYLKHIKETSTGTTVRHSSNKVLSKYLICYPSKEEQTKIASFLSAVDEKMSQLTQKHKLLSQYKQGMMQKLFSQQIRFKADDGSEFGEWEEATLGQTGKFIGGGTPSKENSEFWEGSIPWISSSDLTDESIFKINISRYISSDGLNQSATKLVPANSILIVSRVGVGKVATTPHEICTSQDFTNLTLTDGNSIFFAYLIKSLTPYLLEMNQGTSIKGFVKDDLSSLEIQVPCLEEQTKIANFLFAIDQKIEVVAQQIEQAKRWKKGLLQQMFV